MKLARHFARRVRSRARSSSKKDTGDPDARTAASDADRSIIDRAAPFTMVSPERLLACMDATEYVVRRGVPGALVECGVWQGGSMLAMIFTLQREGVTNRDVYLFDTFEGMTRPANIDTTKYGRDALPIWHQAQSAGRRAWDWWFHADHFNIDSVKETIYATGYPSERIHFVKGMVEETLPASAPESIAILRLDTDWYESTKHELTHLYPLLSPGGVLLVDDYGHWDGCRRAVDEYFEREAAPVLLARTDYTGRMAVKS